MKFSKENNNILGSDHIGQLLFKLSMPAMIGMIVSALYNVVDAIFVGRYVGSVALAAVGIVLPINIIVLGFALMLGLGGASLVSRSLGAKDMESAEKTLGNVFSCSLLIGIAITVIGFVFCDKLLLMFGATQEILPYSRDYLKIILLGTIFFSFGISSNHLIRSEGRATIAMTTMLIGAVLNIILDPIFIIVFKMGIKGAAIATVISQAIPVLYILYFFLSRKSAVHLRLHRLALDMKILKDIFAIGISSFVRQIAGCFLIIILNKSLGRYGGSMEIAIFNVINRLAMFFLMPIFGIGQGMQPIVGYNFGAKRIDKVVRAMHLATIVSTIVSTIGLFVLFVFSKQVMSLFSKDPELIMKGEKILRIMILLLPTAGYKVMGATLFQAIGKAWPSFWLSLSTQLLFLVPLVWILPRFWGINGIWVSFPISDGLAYLFTLVLVSKQMRKFRNHDPLQV